VYNGALMTVRPIRVGVVGIGFGQHVHVPAFRADGRAAVTALCASTLERARGVADRLGIEHAFGDFRALCASTVVDAISMAVPAAVQPAVVAEAARHGKHVFCEKPVALDAAAAHAMLAAVRAAGVVSAVDFEFGEIPAWRQAREVIAGGRLGKLRQVAVTWRVETMANRPGAGASWKRRLDDGGGALNLFVSHSLYYVEWLFGRIARLHAHLRPAGAPADAGVEAWLVLEDGTEVTLSVASDAFLGSGHALVAHGEAGTLVLENPTTDYIKGFILRVGTRENAKLEVVAGGGAEPPGDGRVAAVASLASRFLDAIAGERPGPALDFPTLADGLRVQQLMDLIRRSDASGTWQTAI